MSTAADGHSEIWERSASFVEQPLLSALVFVYGAERFMRGLLEDLCAQTIAPEMEIIVVDTGSPTGEARIVREFMARYPNIAYLRTADRETTTSACNRCITAARGKYLTLACADDRHQPDALERLVGVLERSPEAILAYADVAVTDTENESCAAAHVVGHFRWPEFEPRRLFQVCHVGPQPVYRRTLHQRHGLYDPAYVAAGDYELWLRVVARGERFVHVPETLGLYLRSPSSNEHANQALSIAESEKARIVHWPDAWGERPPAAGNYFVPATPAPPLVSVIMPTYDRPQWLQRAVASVLAQTYPNVELIVANDGGAAVESLLAPLDQRGQITYLRLARNLNRSAARNAALKLARGTYVAYLDDDDWYLPEHLALLVGALERAGGAVAYGFANRVTEVQREGGWVQTANEPIYRVDFQAEALLVGNFIPLPCLVHRRDCLDAVGAFDEELITHEDWDLLIRLAARHPFHQVKETTCCFSWRNDGSSTTSQHRADFARTQDLVYERYAHLAAHSPAILAAQQNARGGPATRPTPAAPECSIVIPLFNRAELTRQCLTALAAVTDDVPFEVILVDNGSSDGTAQLLGELSGNLQVIRNEENLGFARACNQGAAAAHGRNLVFLNNDTIPLRGWLRALVDAIDARPDCSVVGSKLLYPDGTIQHAGVVFNHSRQACHLYAHLPGDFAPANRAREFQVVTAACMLVRREAFEAAGGFDEGFRNSFEDVDLCLRIREQGGRVLYEPKSVLFHLESQSEGRHAHDSVNGVRLAKRWRHVSLADQARTLLADGMAVRSSGLDDHPRAVIESLAEPHEERCWAVVAEAERLAAEAGFSATAHLLEHAADWPADPAVLRWAADELCPRAGLPERAPAFWSRLLALEENTVARAALATAALEHGDAAAADEHVSALLARRPEDPRGWLVRGVLALQQQAFAAAADAFRRAAVNGGDARKCALGLGMAALGSGANEEAWQTFADLVREQPEDAEAVHWLLRAGCVLERWRALRPFLAESVARAPRDAALRFALAGIQVRLGDLDAARGEYQTLCATAPEFDGLASLASALETRPLATAQRAS